MNTRIRLAVLCVSLSAVVFLIGCGKSETASSGAATTDVSNAPSSDSTAVAGGAKKTNGAVPDTSVMPAPGGVKTGTDGGKK